ncbi:MAG TPA: hypothetical protein VMY88_06980 [Acidimicrobiales bacterium]|nr:hypothetical protein [Acidimicrobiales bacterium]
MTQVRAGTLVVGAGFGANLGGYTGGDVSARDVTSAGVTVGAGAAAGGISLSVASPVGLVYRFTSGGTLVAPAMKPGDQLDFLVFFPNGGILSSDVQVTTQSGSVTETDVLGTGSATLDVAAEGDGGNALAIAGVATGTTLHNDRLDAGIVGTIIRNCRTCTGSWSTPDGRQGEWRVPDPDYPYGTYYQFAGPAGEWAWTWSGTQAVVGESSADYGAFVPVGDDWPLFRSGSGS